jgi:hypothetical protein
MWWPSSLQPADPCMNDDLNARPPHLQTGLPPRCDSARATSSPSPHRAVHGALQAPFEVKVPSRYRYSNSMSSSSPSAGLWLRLVSLLLLASVALAQLPRNPTRLLRHASLVYVFEPASDGSSQFQLGSVDVSSRVSTANLPYTTLYPTRLHPAAG